MNTTPTLQKDVYKEYHRKAYHPQVTEVYSNFTNRSGKHSNTPLPGVFFVGLQYSILDHLIDEWGRHFFALPEENAVAGHARIMSAMLGYEVDVGYLRALHQLGYLPIEIKALPEGTFVPYQVPCFTVRNTHEAFAWLPNALETVLSTENWPIQTSATTAATYMARFRTAFDRTGGPSGLLPFMGHDFSFRGMFGRHAAAMSGFGHLAAGFAGTDTIPAVAFAEKYYDADLEKELVGCSVDATEHSVTCSWIEEGEVAFIRYLMKDASPKGILSIVADTWDFWKLVTTYLPLLKTEIMQREGKVVIRPDSGEPVDILCGDLTAEPGSPQFKGLIECLWDTFGGTETAKGFRLLDDHVGAIYGDAITLERQAEICRRLEEKGFVPAVVLGIGSFTYQHVTRDTHGSAIKATNVVKNGQDLAIYKMPKTDPGKKSHRGLLRVERDPDSGQLVCFDQQTRDQEDGGLLQPVFRDGKLLRRTTLAEIRKRIANEIPSLPPLP